MDILLKHSIEILCLGHIVRVPIPEAYVLHKMVINEERGAKAEKDARAVENMLPYVEVSKLYAIYEGLTKKERARVKEFAVSRNLI